MKHPNPSSGWRRTAIRLLMAGVLVGAVPALPEIASAQNSSEDDGAARRHFRLAQAHYENGDFAEAAAEFQAAYDLSQRPTLLYNLYLAHRDALNIVAARDALRLYLTLVPDTSDREALEGRLAQLDRVIEEQGLTADTSAEEPADDDDASEDAGAPVVTGAEAMETEATAASAEDSGPGALPWIVVGSGGAVMATGIVLQGLSRQKYNELESLCFDGVCAPSSDWESIRDKGERLALAGDILTFTGLAAVAAGVALYFFLPGDDAEDEPADGPRTTASVACDASGCMAAVTGSF